MKQITCTDLNAEGLLAAAMAELNQGGGLELHAEGPYVSTVAYTVARLKADHSDLCRVKHVRSNENEHEGILVLTVQLLPGPAAGAAAAAADAGGAEPGAANKEKKRRARERTFTTLSRQPPPPVAVGAGSADGDVQNSPTSLGQRTASSPQNSPIARSPVRGPAGITSPGKSPGARRRSSAYAQYGTSPRAATPAQSAGGQSDYGDEHESEVDVDDGSLPITVLSQCLPPPDAPPRKINFQELFYQCKVTRKRPAARLFPKHFVALSEAEAQRYYEEHPEECVAICYDLSEYNEVAWNYKCNRWCTPSETDFFETIIECLYDTMGEFMVEAVKDKDISCVENDLLACASCSMQGWRVSNEDAHTALLELPTVQGVHMFGVYDGHGGWRVANFVREHLYKIIDVNLGKSADLTTGSVMRALEKSFLDTDTSCCATLPQDHSGTTGTTVNCILIVNGKTVVIANSGDSRAVLCRKGRADRLSHDHKPDSPTEHRRIRDSGSRVSADARVEGMLAVSRAMGDFDFKQAGGLPQELQAVTSFPSVESRELENEDYFIIQACDGIWDVMTDQEVVDFVRDRLDQNTPPADICAQLCDVCLAPSIESQGLGTDNMTLNLIVFKGNKYRHS